MLEKDSVILDLEYYNDFIKKVLLLERIENNIEKTDELCYLPLFLIKELFDIDDNLIIALK